MSVAVSCPRFTCQIVQKKNGSNINNLMPNKQMPLHIAIEIKHTGMLHLSF